MVKLSYMSLVRLIEAVSTNHENVNSFFLDRYQLSQADDIRYAAVVLTTNSISVSDNITTVSFNLLYADRLTVTRCNCLQIQTEGIRILSEIINAVRNLGAMPENIDYAYDITIDEYTIQLFREGFADSTAGAWAQISMSFASEIGSCDWIDKDICKCLDNG